MCREFSGNKRLDGEQVEDVVHAQFRDLEPAARRELEEALSAQRDQRLPHGCGAH
jgi:hypothetical protein